MNLVFTGFMGTGKSKIGKIVSEKLKMSFFDTDDLIEKKSGFLISDIFKKSGEAEFRQMEAETVKEVSEKQKRMKKETETKSTKKKQKENTHK